MKKNQLTTHKSSSLLLGKSKSLMKITKKLLESKSKELANHKDITIIGDLMWEKESRRMSWDDGMEYAKNLRLGGYDDWRLPTKEELGEVVTLCGGELVTFVANDWKEKEDKNLENVLYQEAYKAIGFDSNAYWSSTTVVGDEYRAWYIYFRNGFDNWGSKSNSYYVRCVRDGQ